MGKKILIVDDEPTYVEMLQTRLEASGYDVIKAYNGREGIDKAVREAPDLILMDIMMPEVDGGEAVVVLKRDPQTARVPVIFLTAIVSRQEEEQKKRIKIKGRYYPIIAKPFESEVLMRKITEALGE